MDSSKRMKESILILCFRLLEPFLLILTTRRLFGCSVLQPQCSNVSRKLLQPAPERHSFAMGGGHDSSRRAFSFEKSAKNRVEESMSKMEGEYKRKSRVGIVTTLMPPSL